MRQDGSFAKNGITCARLSARRTITSPVRLRACTWKTFLARSMPTVDFHRGGSKLVVRDSTTLALERREREPSTPSAFALALAEADAVAGSGWQPLTQSGTPEGSDPPA